MGELKLLPTQYDFVVSEKKYSMFSGGLGSGKSYALCVWIIYNALAYPDCIGLITANTYKQLRRATLTTLFSLLDELNIKFSYKSTGELTIGKALIYTVSMENYDSLRGMEVGWVAADEFAFYKPEAVSVMLGRIRDKRGPLQMKASSTPQGFNFAYEMFVEKATDDTFIVYSSSNLNPHLPGDYVKSLESQYDDKLIQQELSGKFINLSSGQVYHAFNRAVHVQEFPMPELLKPQAGCDFNVDPLTAAICFVENNKIFVYDEVFLRDSNTYELAKELVRTNVTAVYPDSTGSARKTSATRTDHQILKDANLNVVYTHNPEKKDRYNCVNGLLAHRRIVIHPRCKNLIKDLEKFTHENDDKMLSHISDSLGYLAWKLFPLVPAKTPARVIIR